MSAFGESVIVARSMKSARQSKWWYTSTHGRWLRRVSRVYRLAMGWVPVSGLGLAVGAGAWWALQGWGRGRQDVVYWVAGHAMLGVLAVSVVTVWVGAAVALWSVRRRARSGALFVQSKDPAEAGGRVNDVAAIRASQERGSVIELETWAETRTGLTMPSLWWLPWVRARWRWVHEGAETPDAEVVLRRAGREVEERVTLRDRGEYARVVRAFRIDDMLGFASVTFRHAQAVSLRVLPRRAPVSQNTVFVAQAAGDDSYHALGDARGDRAELRRYAPGDPARFIHWKNFARTRKLVTRVPERAMSPRRAAAVYFIAAAEDDATAEVARSFIESGAFGDNWVFSADGSDSMTSSKAHAMHMLVRSVRARDQGAGGLGRFLRQLRNEGPHALILFAPGQLGDWLPRVQAALAGREGRRAEQVVIGVPSPPRGTVAAWRRWVWTPSREQASSWQRDEHARSVRAALTPLASSLWLIDCQTGNIVTPKEAGRASRWKPKFSTPISPSDARV